MELYNKEFVFFEWDDSLKGKKGFFADTINELKSKVKNGFELLECHFSNNPTGFHFSNSISNNAYQFFYYDPYYEFRKAYIEGKQLQFKTSNGNWEDVDGAPLFTNDTYRIKSEWYIVLGDYGLSLTTEPSENETVLFEGTEGECIQWLDEHKKFENIMLAWKQGKTIETMGPDSYWHKVVTPHWHTDNSYRVVDECKGCMKYNYCCNSNGIRCRGYCVEVPEYVPFDTLEGLITKWEGMNPGCTNRPKCTMPMIWVKDKIGGCIYLINVYEPDDNRPVMINGAWYSLEGLFRNYTFIDDSIIGKVKEE